MSAFAVQHYESLVDLQVITNDEVDPRLPIQGYPSSIAYRHEADAWISRENQIWLNLIGLRTASLTTEVKLRHHPLRVVLRISILRLPHMTPFEVMKQSGRRSSRPFEPLCGR